LRPNAGPTSRYRGSLYGRGLAKAASGDSAGSEPDIAAAKTHDPNIAEEFAGWGIPAK
jgi:hypothetical protein